MSLVVVTAENTVLVNPTRVVAEASTLCFPVHGVPYELQTTLGSGCPFIFDYEHRIDGSVYYRQARSNLTLHVIAD